MLSRGAPVKTECVDFLLDLVSFIEVVPAALRALCHTPSKAPSISNPTMLELWPRSRDGLQLDVISKWRSTDSVSLGAE